jgi:putative spermidine/putrescine transport system substrate-binding protein
MLSKVRKREIFMKAFYSILKLIVIIIINGLFLTACYSTALKSDIGAIDWNTVKTATDVGGLDVLVTAAKNEGELNVIALPRDWCNYGEMMDAFTAKYGIKINSIYPDSGSAEELQVIIDNKGNNGTRAPDVLDINYLLGPLAKDQNLLAPYKVTTFDTIQGVKDVDGYYYVGYSEMMVIEANADVIADLPGSFSDLLDEKYKGLVAFSSDPHSYIQAVQTIYAASLANGGSLDNIKPGLDFFKQLNTDGILTPFIADSGSIANGKTPITFQWSWDAYSDKKNFAGNPKIEIIFPSDVNWSKYNYQAISAYAPHPAAARLWEEYLYSDEGQLTWIKGFCFPARLTDLIARNVVSDELKTISPDPTNLLKSSVPNNEQLSTASDLIKNQWDSFVGLNFQ